MEKLEDILFYHIDKAIKSYRTFAQKSIKDAGFEITIDQWLVLKNLYDNPKIMQIELAERVFKDNASITRIIEILVKKMYLAKEIHSVDKRRSSYKITKFGEDLLKKIQPLILDNRRKALNKLTQNEIEITTKVMNIISNNCKK